MSNSRQRKRARKRSRSILVAVWRGKLYPAHIIRKHSQWRHARLRRIPHGDIATMALTWNYLGVFAQGPQT